MRSILTLIGEDPNREGLLDTPRRYAKALLALSSGYNEDMEGLINNAIFEQKDSGMVIVRDIELFSLCEHHLLPFYGKAHVAYMPSNKVVGLSKIPRLVNAFARRLQIQERLSSQIAAEIMERLAPAGVAVFVEAYHLCVMMRGVEKQNCRTFTTSFLGNLKDDRELRQEVIDCLKISNSL